MWIDHETQISRDDLWNVGEKYGRAWEFVVNVVRPKESFHETFDVLKLVLGSPLRTSVIKTAEPCADAAQAPYIKFDFGKFLQRLKNAEANTNGGPAACQS